MANLVVYWMRRICCRRKGRVEGTTLVKSAGDDIVSTANGISMELGKNLWIDDDFGDVPMVSGWNEAMASSQRPPASTDGHTRRYLEFRSELIETQAYTPPPRLDITNFGSPSPSRPCIATV